MHTHFTQFLECRGVCITIVRGREIKRRDRMIVRPNLPDSRLKTGYFIDFQVVHLKTAMLENTHVLTTVYASALRLFMHIPLLAFLIKCQPRSALIQLSVLLQGHTLFLCSRGEHQAAKKQSISSRKERL